jgi:Transposase
VRSTDLNARGAALLIALLAGRGQQVLYIPGRIVHHAAATYRGDGKTDAKDARIIADQARMRCRGSCRSILWAVTRWLA